jgi:hypothetical protein
MFQDGFTRIVLQSHRSEAHTNSSSGREKTGRIIKRMLDVECYRLLALLALPLALQMKAPMHQLETRMRELVRDLDAMGAVSGRPADVTQDRRMLEEIIQLSSEAEKISAAISPRCLPPHSSFDCVQCFVFFCFIVFRRCKMVLHFFNVLYCTVFCNQHLDIIYKGTFGVIAELDGRVICRICRLITSQCDMICDGEWNVVQCSNFNPKIEQL